MPRILISLLVSFLLAGMAAAQPPVDYTLMCDDGESQIVIGAASYVDGELHVALVEGGTCDGGTAYVAQHPELIVEISDGVVTISIGDDESEPLTAVAKELPPQAIAGMVTAQERRAPAFAREARGHEQSATAIDEQRPARPEAAGGGRP